jgi:hypothetical protein
MRERPRWAPLPPVREVRLARSRAESRGWGQDRSQAWLARRLHRPGHVRSGTRPRAASPPSAADRGRPSLSTRVGRRLTGRHLAPTGRPRPMRSRSARCRCRLPRPLPGKALRRRPGRRSPCQRDRPACLPRQVHPRQVHPRQVRRHTGPHLDRRRRRRLRSGRRPRARRSPLAPRPPGRRPVRRRSHRLRRPRGWARTRRCPDRPCRGRLVRRTRSARGLPGFPRERLSQRPRARLPARLRACLPPRPRVLPRAARPPARPCRPVSGRSHPTRRRRPTDRRPIPARSTSTSASTASGVHASLSGHRDCPTPQPHGEATRQDPSLRVSRHAGRLCHPP